MPPAGRTGAGRAGAASGRPVQANLVVPEEQILLLGVAARLEFEGKRMKAFHHILVSMVKFQAQELSVQVSTGHPAPPHLGGNVVTVGPGILKDLVILGV